VWKTCGFPPARRCEGTPAAKVTPVDKQTRQPTEWERVLAVLRPAMHPGAFDTWFRPTKLLGREGETLKVRVPNDMFAEWLRSQYMPTIESALPKAGLSAARVEFVTPQQVVPAAAARPPVAPPRLNARYTFENFVVSSCNQFAHAAALAVSEQLGSTYNPLFLYGGVGLGKTHLMQAIGNRLMRTRPDVALKFKTSEEFMNELITAIRFEETPQFRERYRSLDVLLIDDVQFLAGKESTQEEFFHTFNTLYDAGRQIVITSDCPPRKIPALEERLCSRFEWGLIADISPPDLETKVAILNKMASSQAWALSSDVALFIASHVHTNVRELEGCLTTLMAQASVRGRKPDLDLAREVVRSLLPQEEPQVNLDAIVRVVARHFELRASDLKSKTNARRISYPRQIAMYLGKKLAGESLPAIGQYLGGKHHTTVLHAVRKIDELRSAKSSVNSQISQIEEQLR
jgi:chromosomal replication initiator protein